MILLRIRVDDFDGFQTLAVIPAACCFLKLSSVQEMRNFLSVNLHVERSLFSVDRIQMDLLHR